MENKITGRAAVDLIKSKMWHHLPNGTCMQCGKSYTGGVYKQLGDVLVCEKCVIMIMISNDATAKELRSETKKAKSEK